jgi:Uma2 family endonuclease
MLSDDELDPRDVIDGVHYPSSDGKPMAETGIHVNALIDLYGAVQDLFKDSPDVFIAANMFWYWEEGNPEARCDPDLMIVPGVGRHERRAFRSWQEKGAVPAVVFEMASQKTWREDLEERYDVYERFA